MVRVTNPSLSKKKKKDAHSQSVVHELEDATNSAREFNEMCPPAWFDTFARSRYSGACPFVKISQPSEGFVQSTLLHHSMPVAFHYEPTNATTSCTVSI